MPSGTSSGSSGVSEVLEVLVFLMFWSAFVSCFYVVSDRVVLGHLDCQAAETGRSRLPHEGAWQCPVCASLNLRNKIVCAVRGCHRGRPLTQQFKKGDWFCRDCGSHNYARRATCCNTHCPSLPFKPGDWRCPQCSNHNYAHRTVCNSARCKTPRP